VLNQAVMVTRYLYLAVWPGPLVIYYGWPRPLAIVDVWAQGLFIVLLLALTIALLLRKPRLGFLGAWFFLILAPTSSILPIATEVGAERRMYLPLAALISAAVTGSVFVVRRWWPRAALTPRAAVMAAVLAAVPLAVSTAGRNGEYASALTLARSALDRWPSAQAHYLVGTELAAAGRGDIAIVHLREAAAGYPAARFPLGSELLKTGNTAEGIQELQRFLREEPNVFATRSAHGLLADAFAARREFEAAIPHYREYLAAFPNDGHAWTGLGIALISSGRAPEAVEAFRRAVASAPDNVRFRLNLARALLDSGNLAEAATVAREAAAANPADPAPHDILARIAVSEGRLDAARLHFQRALQVDPSFAPALDGLRALTR
jgi:Flp pilus assembly protein TadD